MPQQQTTSLLSSTEAPKKEALSESQFVMHAEHIGRWSSGSGHFRERWTSKLREYYGLAELEILSLEAKFSEKGGMHHGGRTAVSEILERKYIAMNRTKQ